MSRYNFQSGGAAAGNAIEQFLVQRALMDRQRMLDELSAQNTRVDNERADEQLGLQRSTLEAAQRRQASQDASAADALARKQSADANQAGVRQMIADKIQMGPVGADDARSMAGMAYGSGLDVPGILQQAIQPPKRSVVQTVDAHGRPVHKSVTEAELEAGVQDYVAPKAPSADEPLVAIMGPDGKPVLVPRSQAVNKTPASSREQGRPVTSGDAGRISDLDVSLNDLATLGQQLGTTGAGSKMGAGLPNVITEYTGIGEDSKKRQAVIDRVKQVIGKALEGGVLRKEDEIKYERILPTIGDDPQVAAAKLEGLRKALEQRRSIVLDDLGSAGYDTDHFKKPAAPPAASGDAAHPPLQKFGATYQWDGSKYVRQ